VDFGLAKLNQDNRKLTQSGELWGSPPYMSPEQAQGKPEDERSDIYSFGAVLYEMLTGKDPFHYAISVFELIQTHVKSIPPSIAEANPAVSIPPKLEQVVFKALAKDPADRFQTAAEMLNAIVEATAGMRSGESGDLLLLADTGRSRVPAGESNGTFAKDVGDQARPDDLFKRALDPMRGMTAAEQTNDPVETRPRVVGAIDEETLGSLAKLTSESARVEKPRLDNIRNPPEPVDQPKSDFRLFGLGAVAVFLLTCLLVNTLSPRMKSDSEQQARAPQVTPEAASTTPANTATTAPGASPGPSSTPSLSNERSVPSKRPNTAIPHTEPTNEPNQITSKHATSVGVKHAVVAGAKHVTNIGTKHVASVEPKHIHSTNASLNSSKSNPWDTLQGLRHTQKE
jgi:serine/threonine protein kinase